MKVKTIDIHAYEWFDKINGNSYFAGIITVNRGLKDQKEFKMPFQYGYGEHYRYTAARILNDEKIINLPINTPLWKYCEDNKIKLYTSKTENCKQKQLKNL